MSVGESNQSADGGPDGGREINSLLKADELSYLDAPLTVLGCALAIAWGVFLIWGRPLAAPSPETSFSQGVFAPAIMLGSFVVCALALLPLSRRLSSVRHVMLLALATAALGAAAAACPFEAVKLALEAATFLFLLSLWAILIYEKESAFVFLSAAIILAALIFALSTLLPLDTQYTVVNLLPFASLFVYAASGLPIRKKLSLTLSEAAIWKPAFSLSHFIVMILIDFIVGIALFLTTSNGHQEVNPFLLGVIGAITGLAVGLIVFICSRTQIYLEEKGFFAAALCLVGCVVLIASVLLGTAFAPCGVAMLIIGGVVKTCDLIRDTSQVFDRPFSELHLFALHSLMGASGGLLGYVAASTILPLGSVQAGLFFAAIALCIQIAIAYGSGSFAGENKFVSLFNLDEDEGKQKGAEEGEEPANLQRSQESALLSIAKDYGLTTRQAEIFVGMARGRNAKYLMDHFCLAEGTVKTHMAAVYRKLEVHSRQELIDKVEKEIDVRSR